MPFATAAGSTPSCAWPTAWSRSTPSSRSRRSAKSSSARRRNRRISPEARRAISRTIADIAARYIRPAEGTYDFALMYVASEAVFYHAFVAADGADELARAALSARVIPVSPSSLFLYLQTVAHGLRGFLLSADQRRLAVLLEELQRDLTALARAHATLGGHLRNAARSYEESLAPLGGLDRAVSRITRPED